MHTLSDAIFRPLANYNFLLQVEGMYDVPCKSVKGINQEQEYEYIQEGGLNDRVHMRKKQQSKPYTFQVERYVGTPYEDIFIPDRVFNMPLLLIVSRYQEFFLKPSRIYKFNGCRVTSKDYGEFQSEQSGFLTESVTISYDTLECNVNNIDVEPPQLFFKGDIPAVHGQGAALMTISKAVSSPYDRNKRKWPEVSSAKKYYGI